MKPRRLALLFALAVSTASLRSLAVVPFGQIDEDEEMMTAAEVAEYIDDFAPDLSSVVPTSRTIGGVALDADIPLAGRLEVTNNTLRVYAATNAVSDPYGEVLAWALTDESAARIAALSNLVVALTARVAALEKGGATSAWATYDAQGNENADGDVLALNRPYTQFSSGFHWATSGGLHFLASSGAVAFAADDGGEARLFGSSATNSVGIVMGGTNVVVGCNASGITVNGNTVSVTYPWSGGDKPTIWGASTLAGPWVQMESAVWTENAAAGTATATFSAAANSFFFKATAVSSLGEYWRARMPSYFQGGVMVGPEDVAPVVYDSAITVQSGGATYRLPAQRVLQ